MNLYLHLKRLFYNAFKLFLPQVEQSVFCLQDKGVAQSISENFGFHNDYDDEYEEVFIIFWTLQTNFCDSARVKWLLGPQARSQGGFGGFDRTL